MAEGVRSANIFLVRPTLRWQLGLSPFHQNSPGVSPGYSPDLPPYGAGEGSHKPLIAAVANAIYDATGVRIRRPPFRAEKVLEALKTAKV